MKTGYLKRLDIYLIPIWLPKKKADQINVFRMQSDGLSGYEIGYQFLFSKQIWSGLVCM